jgi:signal transduction histidine kinase
MIRKRTILSVLFIIACIISQAQNIDSLKKALARAAEDTNRINTYTALSLAYLWSYPDSALQYSTEALELSKKINFKRGEIFSLQLIGEGLAVKGNYSKALELTLKALELTEVSKEKPQMSRALYGVGNVYFYSGDYQTALKYYLHAASYAEYLSLPLFGFIGEAYYHLGNLDSSAYYIGLAVEQARRLGYKWTIPYYYMGAIYNKKRDAAKALEYYRQGLPLSAQKLDFVVGYLGVATVFKNAGDIDSSIFYATKVLNKEFAAFPSYHVEAGRLLTEIYKPINKDSAFKYQEIMVAANDSLFSKEKMKEIQNLSFNEQMRHEEIKAEERAYRNRLKMYGLVTLGGILLVVALMLWRNNNYRRKAFRILEQQKAKTDQQKIKAEKALEELKATQAQLMQSEKMASLGELTAGIAHEIQNPLNFINNFSEVSSELSEDLKKELDVGKLEEAKAIATGISENMEKIVHHGRRADSIVRNMLQHSRKSSGVKEPTDINALADEYLRLSYHGLRAKDKSFNATLETDYDPSIGKIPVIPQDMGRVMLNLFNNAFYSLMQKKQFTGNGYTPSLSVNTKKTEKGIEINVRDNGVGIPKKLLEKIYQPFFTTKPAGEGTGLGLSICYDIVTKVHGGTMKAETVEGEFTSFNIELPA